MSSEPVIESSSEIESTSVSTDASNPVVVNSVVGNPVAISPGVTSAHVKFGTTIAHQAFLLVSSAFSFFGLIFLWLYSDRTWFGIDLLVLTIPMTLFTFGITHLFLTLLETPSGCKCTSLISRGLPLTPYQRWVEVNEPGFPPAIKFGNRRAIWSAIDGAELTFLGNLRLLTRSNSGAPVKRMVRGKEHDDNPPQLIFKIPFGMARKADQSRLIELIRTEHPGCRLNDRLLKQIKTIEPMGSAAVLNIVSLFFVVFFVDVIFSTFSYLEILKNYTIARESAEALPPDMPLAQAKFEMAEHIRENPLPISWVTTKVLRSDSTKSGLMQIRADSLWAMGRKDDAIASMRDALEEHGKNFRAELKLARMLVENHQLKDAYEILDKASAKSKKAFVPKMYVLALLQHPNSAAKETGRQYYDRAMKSLDEELFKDNTGWPPGVSPYLPDVWHREDVDFVFTKMMRDTNNP